MPLRNRVLAQGFHFIGLWAVLWNFQKVCMVNFSQHLLQLTRHYIGSWQKIEQVSDEMKYVWPTQRSEWWWHFQTHGSMNVYTVWKKIDQWVRSVGRSVKKNRWFSQCQKSICPEKKEQAEYEGESKKKEDGYRGSMFGIDYWTEWMINWKCLLRDTSVNVS